MARHRASLRAGNRAVVKLGNGKLEPWSGATITHCMRGSVSTSPHGIVIPRIRQSDPNIVITPVKS
jgi:hypothetical protein